MNGLLVGFSILQVLSILRFTVDGDLYTTVDGDLYTMI